MKVHAQHLGKMIHLKEVQKALKKHPSRQLLRDPLVMKTAPKQFFVVLKYGVVVYWNMTKREEDTWTAWIQQFLSEPFDTRTTDLLQVNVPAKREGIYRDKINMYSLDSMRVAIVSLILGRSVALEHYELEVGKALVEFDGVMKTFGERGEPGLSAQALLKKVGFAMNVQHLSVSQMALLDKPDLTWDDSEIDKFYNQLLIEFELEDRYDVLNEKLKLIFHNVEFILDFLDARRSLALEVTVVLLIVIEIILFVYELWRI